MWKLLKKTLQFGAGKCKSMLIGKKTDHLINCDLLVDEWTVEYKENTVTGDADLYEYYSGQVPIWNTVEETYLGFVISSTGDNMAQIRQIKNKS